MNDKQIMEAIKHLKGLPLFPAGLEDDVEEDLSLGEPDIVPKEAASNLHKAYEIEDLSHLISFDTYWDE